MFVAFFSTIAPMIGGLMADFFASNTLTWNIRLTGTEHINLNLLNLQGWNYFFIIGGILAMLSLRLLAKVKEQGETHRARVVLYMRATFRNKLRSKLGRETANNLYAPSLAVRRNIIKLFKSNTATAAYRKSA